MNFYVLSPQSYQFCYQLKLATIEMIKAHTLFICNVHIFLFRNIIFHTSVTYFNILQFLFWHIQQPVSKFFVRLHNMQQVTERVALGCIKIGVL